MMDLKTSVANQLADNVLRTKKFIALITLAISNGNQSIQFEGQLIHIFYRKTDYVDGLDNYFIEFLLDVRLYKRIFNITFIKNELNKIYHIASIYFDADNLTIKIHTA